MAETTQNKTTVVNIKHDEYDVLIDRTTKWGNKFIIGRDGDRNTVVMKYFFWITAPANRHLIEDIDELRGKRLGCHCKPYACHGDVLVALLELVDWVFEVADV